MSSMVALGCLASCAEIGRITFVPNVDAAQFSAMSTDICLSPFGQSATPALADFLAALDASPETFRVVKKSTGYIAYHVEKDAVFQIREIAQPLASDTTQAKVRCVAGADVTNPSQLRRELFRQIPNLASFNPEHTDGTLSLTSRLALNGSEVAVSIVPEGSEVLSRDLFELGSENDYRYTSLVVENSATTN
ncbi:MAG: hypothetical protein AAGH70_11500 [Pseudomonadota bacterium]